MCTSKLPLRFLLVEDNAGDADLVKVAMERFSVPHVLEVAADGELAIEAVLGAARGRRLPDLIILDLNVPRLDGHEVLAAIRANEATRHIPVVVFTSSSAPRDMLQAYRGYANCCIRKPSSARGFFEVFALLEKLVNLHRDRTWEGLEHLTGGAVAAIEENGLHKEPVHILLVEDNAGDVDLVKVAMAQFSVPYTLDVQPDGELAIAALGSGRRLPDLMILDLNVPKMDGRAVLAAIKRAEETRHIPVLVFTSSTAERDLLEAYRAHANCCLTKPPSVKAFLEVFALIERFWLQLVRLPPHPESIPL